jgi:hypothetical protein
MSACRPADEPEKKYRNYLSKNLCFTLDYWEKLAKISIGSDFYLRF